MSSSKLAYRVDGPLKERMIRPPDNERLTIDQFDITDDLNKILDQLLNG